MRSNGLIIPPMHQGATPLRAAFFILPQLQPTRIFLMKHFNRWMSRYVVGVVASVTLMTASSVAWAQKVLLNTSMGDIVIELNAAKAPKTVENFVQYVKDGHYDGTVFHRVISNFMIQGGGMTPDLKEKPTRATIPLESQNGLKNDRGTVAMARKPDPNSASAQFFINVQNNDFLNAAQSRDGNGYAVFATVVSGMDVVDKIRATPTGTQGMYSDVPLKPVIIQKASIQK
jgi:peptidyl-prolyl cis-trans isomerase A (cyclophilin A)